VSIACRTITWNAAVTRSAQQINAMLSDAMQG
jgi:hypothetical protein